MYIFIAFSDSLLYKIENTNVKKPESLTKMIRSAVWRLKDNPILPAGPQTLTMGFHFVMETEN